jgi:hypothetical protein
MSRAQCFIIKHSCEWKNECLGKHYGPFPSQTEALEAAVEKRVKCAWQENPLKYLFRVKIISSELNEFMGKTPIRLRDNLPYIGGRIASHFLVLDRFSGTNPMSETLMLGSLERQRAALQPGQAMYPRCQFTTGSRGTQ